MAARSAFAPSITNRYRFSAWSPRATRSSSSSLTTVVFSVAPCQSPKTCFFPLVSMPSATTRTCWPRGIPSIRIATKSSPSSFFSHSFFSCAALACTNGRLTLDFSIP
jgi:hypothetical protein